MGDMLLRIGENMEILIGLLGLMITILGGALGWFSKAITSLTKTLADVDKKLALLIQADETMDRRVTTVEDKVLNINTRLCHLEGDHAARYKK